LDLQQGLWTVVGKTFPVRELKIDSAGKLWAVEALHHLGTVSGLRVFDGRSWDVFAFTEMDRPEKTKNWPLPSGPFQSVAFTTAGEVFVLVDGHGIARWNQKEWRYVTKGWPRYKFMGEPYPLFANSFCLAGSIAVVSMYDAGLALWDLKSNDVTRLTLR
jgi:hypothetical protein